MLTSIELASKAFDITYRCVDGITDGALKQIGVQLVKAVNQKTGLNIDIGKNSNSESENANLKKLQEILYQSIEADVSFKQTLDKLVENFERQEVKNTQQNIK